MLVVIGHDHDHNGSLYLKERSIILFILFYFFRITSMAGEQVFTCRVIHSLPLLMSAIHVFCKDKLSVVCQLIGSDQLPVSSQV